MMCVCVTAESCISSGASLHRWRKVIPATALTLPEITEEFLFFNNWCILEFPHDVVPQRSVVISIIVVWSNALDRAM